MKIYNTMSRRKEEFVPIQPGKVGIYVCGPTVYDLIHIGNARPMIVFDTLRRYLTHRGYEVNYVSNFTDVDDKIIKRANEEGVSADEISEKYIAECRKDMESLNVLPATVHPQATKEIPDMIGLVEKLIGGGHAYEKNGTVYFRTRSFPGYGKLSHKNIDELESGHRDEAHQLKVSGESEKEDPLDFVLWKPKKEGEPFWKSPWSEGRPGWHLECSCMSAKYIGGTLDIHAGGEDLVFPHHENEIAQSEAANGQPFANYWMHNAFLKINGEKMAKSLGNFFTVRDITAQVDPMIVRFFMLSVHYRRALNFSQELVQDAGTSLERIRNCYDKLKEKAGTGTPLGEEEEEKKKEADILLEKFDAAMDDDLNTADAISAVFEFVRTVNAFLAAGISGELAGIFLKVLSTVMEDVLGVKLAREAGLLDEEVEQLITERTEARKAKNFARADEIRQLLLEKGIVLEDTREGVKWKRT